jgi:hypothetical protein
MDGCDKARRGREDDISIFYTIERQIVQIFSNFKRVDLYEFETDFNSEKGKQDRN